MNVLIVFAQFPTTFTETLLLKFASFLSLFKYKLSPEPLISMTFIITNVEDIQRSPWNLKLCFSHYFQISFNICGIYSQDKYGCTKGPNDKGIFQVSMPGLMFFLHKERTLWKPHAG